MQLQLHVLYLQEEKEEEKEEKRRISVQLQLHVLFLPGLQAAAAAAAVSPPSSWLPAAAAQIWGQGYGKCSSVFFLQLELKFWMFR